MTVTTQHQHPSRPDRVLRVAFAGNRKLPNSAPLLSQLEDTLHQTLETIAERICTIGTPESETNGKKEESQATDFYSHAPPILRLVTGLAEGGDDLAARALERLRNELPTVRYELAGVLGFERSSYRDGRNREFRARFDELYDSSEYVVEADGLYDADSEIRRSRGYRAQATLLLRQADLLIAMADPKAKSGAGGTMETIAAAQSFHLPILFLDAQTAETFLIEPDENANRIISGVDAPPEPSELATKLDHLISRILADPDTTLSPSSVPKAGPDDFGVSLLHEFFENDPADHSGDLRQKLWKHFDRLFHWSEWRTPADQPLEPYESYRKRASSLSAHYATLYRGAFLLNFGLAVLAVVLATMSLVLIGGGHSGLLAALLSFSSQTTETVSSATGSSGFLLLALTILGALKLGVVVAIYYNSHCANRGDWNERAISYRYLAERLRSLLYLPHCGGFQLPAASTSQLASRAIRQSAIDWLADAIVRHVSPATLGRPPEGRAGPAVFRPQPAAALASLRRHWLARQLVYHRNNSKRNQHLAETLRAYSRNLSRAAIIVVVLDLVILLAKAGHVLEPAWFFTPWLVFLAAVLPAAVAGLNGIRMQSECRRLAERSAVMTRILRARARTSKDLASKIQAATSGQDPGSWSVEVLEMAEGCARDLVEEAAEWSVLYAKQIPES